MMNVLKSSAHKGNFITSRSMIWITKNAPLKWKFAQNTSGNSHLAEYISGGQLLEAFGELN